MTHNYNFLLVKTEQNHKRFLYSQIIFSLLPSIFILHLFPFQTCAIPPIILLDSSASIPNITTICNTQPLILIIVHNILLTLET